MRNKMRRNSITRNRDSQFKYSHKNVHDINVANSFTRLWSQKGASDSAIIKKAFQPLLKTTFVYPYVALMPDFHPGKGAMIGSVIPTKDVLLPTVIGNDIGCGMTAVRLPVFSERLKPHLHDLKRIIHKHIPTGTAYNNSLSDSVKNNLLFQKNDKAPNISGRNWNKIMRQFGSLGGGNHFIEIQTDTEGYIWIMLHSGSRFLGVLVRDYYVNAGKDQPDIDPQLYLKIPHIVAKSELATRYLNDMKYTVDFAKKSRREMMLRVLESFSIFNSQLKNLSMGKLMENCIDAPHNYISIENHFDMDLYIHRKGAIRVNQDEMGVVPGSMGSNSYIVEGKGNEFSFCSCSHGAGRVMSRREAFRNIPDKAVHQSMQGVVFDDHLNIKDEAPQAYKDINAVMRGQKDLVKIRYKLWPLLSIKGK